MLSLLLCSLLASAEPTRVLVLDIRADGASETTARVVRDEVAQGLAGDARLEALSSEDVRRVVSLDAERRVLGCADDSCLAEVGQALGARYVIHGSLSVVGALRILRVNVLDTDDNRSVARETVEARSDEDLLPQLRAAVARLRGRLIDGAAAQAPSPIEFPSTSSTSLVQVAGIAVGAVGLVIAGGGGVAMGAAWNEINDLEQPVKTRQQAQGNGQVGTAVLVGGVVIALGGAALAIVGGGP